MAPILSYETQAGEPIRHGHLRLVPFARVLRIHLPRRFSDAPWSAGLAWSRPVSVMAVTDDGQEQMLPVRDVTRQTQLALWGACLGMAIIMGVINVIRSKSQETEP